MSPSFGVILVLLISEPSLTYSQHNGQDMPIQDACSLYEVVDDPLREIASNAGPARCDDALKEGWYRFTLHNVSAEIPTTCLKSESCAGSIALRIDLEGKKLPEEGKAITVSLCGSYEVLGQWDCCVLRKSTHLRNCGGFFIYYLYPVDRCPVAYCVQKINTKIPEDLIAKHGEKTDDVTAKNTTALMQCSNGYVQCMSQQTEQCVKLCDGVTNCDNGEDEELCPGEMFTDSTDVFPAPEPDEEENDFPNVTNATAEIIGTRIIVVTTTSQPETSQSYDKSADSGMSSTKEVALSEEESWSTEKDAELTTTTTLRTDTDSTESSSTASSPSGDKNTLITDYSDQKSSTTTPVTTAADTSQSKESNQTYATTSATTYQLFFSDRPEAGTTELQSSSTLQRNHSDTTTSTAAATTESSTTPAETVSLSTDSITLSSTSTATTTSRLTSRDDGRVVIEFVTKDFIKDTKNFTAVIKGILKDVLTVPSNQTDIVNRQSIIVTNGPIQNKDIVSVVFVWKQDNNVVPAEYVVSLIENAQKKNNQTWQEVDLQLHDCYKAKEKRESPFVIDSSLLKDNVVLFISVISLGAVCIIVIIIGLVVIRCRNRRRSYDRNTDLKSSLTDSRTLHSVENPATDAEIMKDEVNTTTKETSLSSRKLSPGPAAEDENGWIVPLDQANCDLVAAETEDTMF